MTRPISPAFQQLRRRLAVPFFMLLLTNLFGACSFWWLWRDQGGTAMDALFMTFITVTTIAFGEVRPLGTAGRVVAMAVAAGGVGSLFYSFGLVLDYLGSSTVQEHRRRLRMQRDIDGLKQHYVVTGFGRVGREAASELRGSGVAVVVVDPNPQLETDATQLGYYFLLGDGSDDATLRAAGLDRAKGLIVTTDSDATNLFVVLSARLLSPTVFIASRAVAATAVPKLLRAGANRAISPYAIGGKRLAHLMLSPGVVDFFETALTHNREALSIGDFVLTPNAAVVGQSLGALNIHESTGAWLLVVVREGNALVHPRGELSLTAGDHVLALGTGDQLERLEQLLAPRAG